MGYLNESRLFEIIKLDQLVLAELHPKSHTLGASPIVDHLVLAELQFGLCHLALIFRLAQALVYRLELRCQPFQISSVCRLDGRVVTWGGIQRVMLRKCVR